MIRSRVVDALNPYVTSSIAVVGASVIAITPVQPAPQLHSTPVSTASVQLTANPTAFEVYSRVVEKTFENLAERGAEAYPVVQRLVDYPIGVVSDIATAIATGDSELLFDTIGKAVTQPLTALATAPITFVTDYALPIVGSLTFFPLAAAALATVYAFRDLFEAIEAANPVDLFNAIVTIPGKIFQGVANGIIDWEFPDSEANALLTHGPNEPIGGNYVLGFVHLTIKFFDEVVPEWSTPTVTDSAVTSEVSEPAPTGLKTFSLVPDDGNAATTESEEAGDETIDLTSETATEPAESTAGETQESEEADAVDLAAESPATPAKRSKRTDLTNGNKVEPGRDRAPLTDHDTEADPGTEKPKPSEPDPADADPPSSTEHNTHSAKSTGGDRDSDQATGAEGTADAQNR